MKMPLKLAPKDFKSGEEVRWCPGCDDYAILNSVQRAMANLGIPREKLCVISGIGCSSRFPYYLDTYGFHGIHGRALAIATGVKLANPDLSVWVATGDGDALSIGGNHLIHALRRNVDVNILLFNNEIYGLTKGQYSPTSQQGLRTKASPHGTVERPFNPLSVAVGAGGTFVARCMAADTKQTAAVLEQAARHRGTAFVEVQQNCVIFNDGTFGPITERKQRTETTVRLVHGEPIVFGADSDRGLKLDGFRLVECPAEEAMTWDAATDTAAPALMLAEIDRTGGLPLPFGVFRSVEAPAFEATVHDQIAAVTEERGASNLKDLVYSGEMWTVE